MDKKELRQKINKLFKQKIVTEKEHLEALKLLEEFKESDQEYYNYIKAKLLFGSKNYQESKKYFGKIIENNPNHASSYYYLYKINIQEEKYQEALYNLCKYKELNPKAKINIDLPTTMLQLRINMDSGYQSYEKDSYYVEKSEYFGRIKITNPQILDLYTKLIEAFNNKNFEAVKKIADKMDEVITARSFPIEVKTITTIIDSILTKENEYFLNNISDESYLKENLEAIANNILNNTIPPYQVIIYLNKIIDINPKLAKRLLSVSLENNKETFNDITIKLLQNKIEEKIKYSNLSPDQKKKFDKLKKKGSIAYHNDNLGLAYDYYEAAKYITEHPIFDYYLGKILYKLNSYKEAEKYLTSYAEVGGEKLEKCLLYLLNINLKRKDNKKAKKIKEKIDAINKDLKNDFALININSYSEKKELEEIDYIKRYASKKIRITEDELAKEQEDLKIEDYYDYNLDQKLLVIKQLLHRNKIQVANHLLNELRPITEKDKEKILQFQRNKKLYVNQNN